MAVALAAMLDPDYALLPKNIAYDPNQRPSRKDDEYCAAR